MAATERTVSGKRIRDARIALGWNQLDLAQKTGFHPDTILKWETGRVSPRPHNWRALSDALGESIRWLRASDLEEERNGREGSRPHPTQQEETR